MAILKLKFRALRRTAGGLVRQIHDGPELVVTGQDGLLRTLGMRPL